MKQVVGLSRQQLETREKVMEGLARRGLRAAVKSISLVGELVTAASVPSISTTASTSSGSLAPVELSVATQTWSDYVDDVLYPFLLETYTTAAQKTWQAVDGALSVSTPKPVPLTAEDYLRAAVNRLKNVGASVWSAIRESLAEGYAAGDSTHQLAARVRTVAHDVGEAKALTIARTEVISAANAASVTQVKIAGFSDAECSKRWLATEDERTRATHRLVDGQVVGLSQPFFVGGEYLQQPGDPTGRADNVINCRCTVEFVFTDAEPLIAADSPGDLTWQGWNKLNTNHPKDAKGRWTNAPGGAINVLPGFGKMTSQQVDTWYKNITQDEWDATSPDVKAKLQKHANLFYDVEGNAGPKNKIKMLDAGLGNDTTVSTPKSGLVAPKWADLTQSETEDWFGGITDEQWAATSDDEKSKITDYATYLKMAGLTSEPKDIVDLLNQSGKHSLTDTIAKIQAEKAAAAAITSKASLPPAPKKLPKSLHINTNVIYKQKYADGAVVAVRPGDASTGDINSRLIWSDSKKKFILQAETSNGSNFWVDVELYGKGDAYKKFSKETGWLEPATTPAAPTPTVPSSSGSTHVKAKLSATQGKHKNVLATDKPQIKKFPTYMVATGQAWEIDKWLNTLTQDEYDAFTSTEKDSLAQKVQKLNSPELITEHAKFLSGTKGQAPVPAAPSPSVPAPSSPPPPPKSVDAMSLPEFIDWFEQSFVKHSDGTQLFDALSFDEKKKIFDKANYASNTGQGNKPLHWLNHNYGYNDLFYQHIKGMSDGAFATWLGPNVDQKTWNDLPTLTQKLIEAKADALSMIGWDGTKNQVAVLKAGETGAKPLPSNSGALKTSTITPQLDVDEFLKKDYYDQSTILKKLSSDQIDALSPQDYSKLAAQATELHKTHWITADEYKKFHTLGTAPAPTSVPAAVVSTPALTPVSSPAPHGYSHHVDVTNKVKFVGDIGQPDTNVKNFKSITTSDMKALQHEMLKSAGKSGFTTNEKTAVGIYGTSAGYQSMNGVLRNDETRLKLFSDAQLAKAVQNAAHVQSAMTPLTEDLELHRGTGAQQFGFKIKSISTDKLKKLQGQTIVDRGFVSTSVVPPTAISYDYAKKPIKVIVKAPKGTPAVYVDSVKPGHGENELLLGAGTNFHVDEVREATAEDKLNFGSHTEQVVTLTIVPAKKLGPKDITGKATPSSASTVTTTAPVSSVTPPLPSPAVSTTPTLKSTGTLGGKPGGVPIKLNTTTIYKQSYAHGAVVGVMKKDGFNYRLVWHQPQQKFIMQIETTPGEWLTATNQPKYKFSKKEAYDKFKSDTHWVTPNPGDTALGTSGWPPKISGAPDKLHLKKSITEMDENEFIDFVKTNKDIIKSEKHYDTSVFKNVAKDLDVEDEVSKILGLSTLTPSVSTAPSAPSVTKPAKAPKFDAAQLQAMHGIVPAGLTNYQKTFIWQSFKFGGSYATNFASPPATVFKKLHKALDAHNANHPADKLNMLQVIKIIDEKASQHSAGGNQNLFEKKIVAWLQTPSGKTTAAKVINPTAAVSKTKTGTTAVGNSLAELLSQVKSPSEIGTPHTKSATFSPISNSDMHDIQNKVLAANPWTTAQKGGLASYTGQSYADINKVLRGKQTLDSAGNLSAARIAKRAQEGMRPITRDILVYRKTGASQFPGLHDSSSFSDIEKFNGKVFQDKGFMSTSIHKGTWTGNVQMEIEVPAGTPGAYVGGPQGISKHKNENELILAAGLRYRVLSVKPYGSSGAIVRLRVEG